jgi:DNA-binding NarL/FixJ family response regulator
VAHERGEDAAALDHAHRALAGRREADREDPHLEILLPAARVILAAGPPDEAAAIRDELQLVQALIGQRTLDSDARAAWFRGPVGGRLSALAGSFVATPAGAAEGPAATATTDEERRLLGLIIEGRTNAEIAAEVGLPVEAVAQALAAMYARIGASSRAEATVMAVSGAI